MRQSKRVSKGGGFHVQFSKSFSEEQLDGELDQI